MKSATKFGCLFTMFLLFVGFLPISAQEHSLFPQEGLKDVGSGKTGSITMQLTKPFDECLSIENVAFGINQIADVVSGEYHLLDEFNLYEEILTPYIEKTRKESTVRDKKLRKNQKAKQRKSKSS